MKHIIKLTKKKARESPRALLKKVSDEHLDTDDAISVVCSFHGPFEKTGLDNWRKIRIERFQAIPFQKLAKMLLNGHSLLTPRNLLGTMLSLYLFEKLSDWARVVKRLLPRAIKEEHCICQNERTAVLRYHEIDNRSKRQEQSHVNLPPV